VASLARDLGLKTFGDRTYENAAHLMEKSDQNQDYADNIQKLYDNAVLGMSALQSNISKCLGYPDQ
jgi:hypothetical protein